MAICRDSFNWLGSSLLFAIPVSVYVTIIVAVIASAILRQTPLGNHIYPLGGQRERGGEPRTRCPAHPIFRLHFRKLVPRLTTSALARSVRYCW